MAKKRNKKDKEREGHRDRAGARAEHEISVSVRMPAALIQRLEALRPALANDPKMAIWGRLTRSTLLRIALLRGIESLERRYKQTDTGADLYEL